MANLLALAVFSVSPFINGAPVNSEDEKNLSELVCRSNADGVKEREAKSSVNLKEGNYDYATFVTSSEKFAESSDEASCVLSTKQEQFKEDVNQSTRTLLPEHFFFEQPKQGVNNGNAEGGITQIFRGFLNFMSSSHN